MSAFGAAIDEEADDEVRPNRAPSGRRGDNDARMSRRCSALRARNRALSHCIFGSFYRASLDDLPRRLRLEYCWLLGERIDALSRFCGGFLDHNEFGESGHNEGTRFLEFSVTNLHERLDDALDVLPGHSVRMLLSNFLN